MTFLTTFICDGLDCYNNNESYNNSSSRTGAGLTKAIYVVSGAVLALHAAQFLFKDQKPSSLIIRSISTLQTGVNGLRLVSESVNCATAAIVYVDQLDSGSDPDPFHLSSKTISTGAIAANFIVQRTLSNPVIRAGMETAFACTRLVSHVFQDGALRALYNDLI